MVKCLNRLSSRRKNYLSNSILFPIDPARLFEKQKVLKIVVKTFQHYFGSFDTFFDRVQDPRMEKKSEYSLSMLLFTGIFMFLAHLEAVRQIKFRLHTPLGKFNFQTLFHHDNIPHGDTLNETFPVLDPDEVGSCVPAMIRRLIRQRVLDSQRLLGLYYLIAVDGSGIYVFQKRHCEHCLTKTRNGKTLYYHYVLEAKLVTINGFCLSIMTEFIENPGVNPSKQDCETKAFLRLAPRLNAAFPHLPIALLMDGMFAEGPVFAICNKYHWKFIIVLKDLDLPSVNQEFNNLRNLETQQTLLRRTEGTRQVFTWINEISFMDTQAREHTLNVLECLETDAETKKYKWIANFEITKDNVIQIASGGRCRWGVETGFDLQKNHGYALEHPYSEDYVGMKVYYFLLQISHIWAQLVERGNWLKKLIPKGLGSLKNFAFQLLEDWRTNEISKECWEKILELRIQIRFDTS